MPGPADSVFSALKANPMSGGGGSTSGASLESAASIARIRSAVEDASPILWAISRARAPQKWLSATRPPTISDIGRPSHRLAAPGRKRAPITVEPGVSGERATATSGPATISSPSIQMMSTQPSGTTAARLPRSGRRRVGPDTLEMPFENGRRTELAVFPDRSGKDRRIDFRCHDYSPWASARVVSRMWWKLPGSLLRACEVAPGQAARSRAIGSMG